MQRHLTPETTYQRHLNVSDAVVDALQALDPAPRWAAVRALVHLARGDTTVRGRDALDVSAKTHAAMLRALVELGLCETPRRGTPTAWRVTFTLNTED